MGETANWRRDDPATWTDESLASVGSSINGIINGLGAGHSELSWYIRTLPRVRRTFATLWGTTSLLSSFDGFNIFRPWHHGFRKTVGSWLHVDQGRTKMGLHAIQGFVALYDQDARTGGLVVLPRSHHRHEEVLVDASQLDHVRLPEYCPVLDMPRRLLVCRAGDLVLWDSRCVHCNTPAFEKPQTPAARLLRAAVYVCMTPKRWAPAQVLRARRLAYELRQSSSHWPHLPPQGMSHAVKGKQSLDDASMEVRALVC